MPSAGATKFAHIVYRTGIPESNIPPRQLHKPTSRLRDAISAMVAAN